MSKRKRPEPKSTKMGLTKEEETINNMIRKKEDIGATKYEIITETKIHNALVGRAITTLKKQKLIKEVKNMNNRGFTHYLAYTTEPSKSLTGGEWYKDGALDLSKIEELKSRCLDMLERAKERGNVMTLDIFRKYFEKQREKSVASGLVEEILKNLVLDNVIMEVKSTGIGEYSSTKIGEVCYKLTGKKSGNGEARVGAFSSVPCGVCPHIALCSPGGVISPTTCSYFQKWLEF